MPPVHTDAGRRSLDKSLGTAQGKVLKTGRPIDVASALREVLVGGRPFDPKTLLARSFTKLGVRRGAEAIAAARERGLL